MVFAGKELRHNQCDITQDQALHEIAKPANQIIVRAERETSLIYLVFYYLVVPDIITSAQ